MILGLSNAKVLGAIVVAICISIAFAFATMPHPVDVPEQTITPVPTPPPVVITAAPTPAPEATIPPDITLVSIYGFTSQYPLAAMVVIIMISLMMVFTSPSRMTAAILISMLLGFMFWLGLLPFICAIISGVIMFFVVISQP